MNAFSVYIYSGETKLEERFIGVAADGVKILKSKIGDLLPNHPIITIESDQMCPNQWPPKSLLVLPGGRTREWKWIHDHEKVEQIKKFVQEGGKVLAFCAGAYGCCEEIEYQERDFLIKEKYGLNFFPGKGIGPLKSQVQPGRLSAQAIQINYDNEINQVLINGGGYFSSRENDFDVLATYKDESKEKSMAIIKRTIGKGMAVMSFVHPEYQAEDFPLQTIQLTYEAFPEIVADARSTYKKLESGRDFQNRCLASLIEEIK